MSRTRRKVKYAKWIRHPKTFQEHRDADGCKVDGVSKRPKRNKNNLPSAWEDQIVAAQYEIVKNPKKKLDYLDYHLYW
jgi:hypothetical protein